MGQIRITHSSEDQGVDYTEHAQPAYNLKPAAAS